jgi:hypothetical protein
MTIFTQFNYKVSPSVGLFFFFPLNWVKDSYERFKVEEEDKERRWIKVSRYQMSSIVRLVLQTLTINESFLFMSLLKRLKATEAKQLGAKKEQKG